MILRDRDIWFFTILGMVTFLGMVSVPGMVNIIGMMANDNPRDSGYPWYCE